MFPSAHNEVSRNVLYGATEEYCVMTIKGGTGTFTPSGNEPPKPKPGKPADYEIWGPPSGLKSR